MHPLLPSRYSSVSIVIRLPDRCLKNRSSIPGSGKSCICSRKRPYRIGNPPSVLMNGWRRLLPRGVKRPEHEADHSTCSVNLRISLCAFVACTGTALHLPLFIWDAAVFQSAQRLCRRLDDQCCISGRWRIISSLRSMRVTIFFRRRVQWITDTRCCSPFAVCKPHYVQSNPVYNDICLCATSSITSDVLWY
jgi:hypothetical protein